jgi:hypothetical protein
MPQAPSLRGRSYETSENAFTEKRGREREALRERLKDPHFLRREKNK